MSCRNGRDVFPFRNVMSPDKFALRYLGTRQDILRTECAGRRKKRFCRKQPRLSGAAGERLLNITAGLTSSDNGNDYRNRHDCDGCTDEAPSESEKIHSHIPYVGFGVVRPVLSCELFDAIGDAIGRDGELRLQSSITHARCTKAGRPEGHPEINIFGLRELGQKPTFTAKTVVLVATSPSVASMLFVLPCSA